MTFPVKGINNVTVVESVAGNLAQVFSFENLLRNGKLSVPLKRTIPMLLPPSGVEIAAMVSNSRVIIMFPLLALFLGNSSKYPFKL